MTPWQLLQVCMRPFTNQSEGWTEVTWNSFVCSCANKLTAQIHLLSPPLAAFSHARNCPLLVHHHPERRSFRTTPLFEVSSAVAQRDHEPGQNQSVDQCLTNEPFPKTIPLHASPIMGHHTRQCLVSVHFTITRVGSKQKAHPAFGFLRVRMPDVQLC